jgi:hypothetical protein
MANSDYYDPNRPKNDLSAHGIPSNPQERKRYEAEMRQQFAQNNKQAQAQMPQAKEFYEQNLTAGGRKRFFVNWKARPIHIPDEDIIVDGQLAVSARGPFIQMSEEKYNSSYQFQTLLEQPLSTINPHLKGKTAVQEVNEQDYKRLYREYLNSKKLRDAEYARVGENVGHHEDGSIDEMDASFEMRRVNPKIIRAQG